MSSEQFKKSFIEHFNFSPDEWSLMKHRLEVPDAIADVVVDSEMIEVTERTRDEVDKICDLLLADDLAGAMAISQDITQIVIANCVECSTYAACQYYANMSIHDRKKWEAACDTGNRAAAKVAIGLMIIQPGMGSIIPDINFPQK